MIFTPSPGTARISKLYSASLTLWKASTVSQLIILSSQLLQLSSHHGLNLPCLAHPPALHPARWRVLDILQCKAATHWNAPRVHCSWGDDSSKTQRWAGWCFQSAFWCCCCCCSSDVWVSVIYFKMFGVCVCLCVYRCLVLLVIPRRGLIVLSSPLINL